MTSTVTVASRATPTSHIIPEPKGGADEPLAQSMAEWRLADVLINAFARYGIPAGMERARRIRE
jgi:hypothetical protein